MKQAMQLHCAGQDRIAADRKRITAEVISCPGQIRDDSYCALQINIEGFDSPYVLILALRAVGYQALSEQGDPAAMYSAIAAAVNDSETTVKMTASVSAHRTPSH